MKEYKLFFVDSTGKQKCHVYAKSLKEAKKTVANLFYVDAKMVFPA